MPKQAIFFLIDSQGSNYVTCYTGIKELGTPNVDRLAAQGVKFDRAYTCSPVCGPARSSIFTGLFPHGNGVLGNGQAPHADLPTVGQRLSDAGIKTGYVGKWHLNGPDYFGSGRAPAGWDPAYWFDGLNYLDSLPDAAARDLSRRPLGPREVAEHGITAEFTHAHRSADKAIEFIRAHKDEDFFLVVSIDEPHHPYISPEPFASAFENFEFPLGPGARDTLEGKPRQQQDWAKETGHWFSSQLRERNGELFLNHSLMFACNSYCDFEVGRVLAEIDATTPRAMVVYTSDHGEMGGAHKLGGKGPAVYEEITHVPLIVRLPGHAPAGGVAPHPVSHIDLAPTFLDYFGVDIPPILQGKSLLETARHPEAQAPSMIFMEFNRFEISHDGFGAFSPLRCAFDGRHKLSLNLFDIDELYDLQTDPAELKNLIDDPGSAEVRDRLHDAVLAWMNETRDPFRGPPWARRSWRDVAPGTWGGPTRPQPFDAAYLPPTRIYFTSQVMDRAVYPN